MDFRYVHNYKYKQTCDLHSKLGYPLMVLWINLVLLKKKVFFGFDLLLIAIELSHHSPGCNSYNCFFCMFISHFWQCLSSPRRPHAAPGEYSLRQSQTTSCRQSQSSSYRQSQSSLYRSSYRQSHVSSRGGSRRRSGEAMWELVAPKKMASWKLEMA